MQESGRIKNDTSIAEFLLASLKEQVASDKIEWLQLQSEKIKKSHSPSTFYMAFSRASRFFSKNYVDLTLQKREAAEKLLSGFRPHTWSHLQVARTLLMLSYSTETSEEWSKQLQPLFETGDIGEQQALYAALSLMPYPAAMYARAREGLRTNMTIVFDAIALDNPYPAQYFEEDAWNQMVLKAIFLQRPLFRIERSDERANAELADILIDYVHERWAAGREVVPELWRFVGPFIGPVNISDFKKAAASKDELEKRAALLACQSTNSNEAKKLLDEYPTVKKELLEQKFDWDDIGIAHLKNQSQEE